MSRQVWKGSTLLNPEPPVLVSCGSPEKPNLITVGWTGTICTQPPMLSISVRPERYSHHLIKESGEFVVNLPTESLVRAIDWCGVKSGRDVDKFAAMHLTAAPAAKVGTVLVEESPVNLECKVTQVIPLGSHDLFLAECVAVDVDERLLDESGKLCLNKAKLIVYSHGDYLALGRKLGSFGYSVRKKKKAIKNNRGKFHIRLSARRPPRCKGKVAGRTCAAPTALLKHKQKHRSQRFFSVNGASFFTVSPYS